MDKAQIGYYLSPLEFTLLIAAKEGEQVIGLVGETTMDENSVALGLHHLYQQQFIENDSENKAFRIIQPLDQMLCDIVAADHMLYIRSAEEDHVKQTYYCNKEAFVCVEVSPVDRNALRIYAVTKEELLDSLKLTEEQMESEKHRLILDEETLLKQYFGGSAIVEEEQLYSLKNIRLLVERINCENRLVEQRLGIQKEAEQWDMICCSKEGFHRQMYQDDLWQSWGRDII